MAESIQRLTDTPVHTTNTLVHTGLLDIPEAARYIGMSTRWLYRHYAIIPHIRIGFGRRPRIRFRRTDLDAWLQQHRILPAE